MWYMLADTAQTGDQRNIILWVILAAVALVLIIARSVMAGISKKKAPRGKNRFPIKQRQLICV